MRPVDVGADVHFLFGLNLPLAVTAATRSRRPDLLEAHLDTLVALGARADQDQDNDQGPYSTPQQHLIPLRHGGSILSVNASCRPTAASNAARALVIVVCRVHGVALGTERSDLRVQQSKNVPEPTR